MRPQRGRRLNEASRVIEQGWMTTYSLRVPHRSPREVMKAWLAEHDRFWPHHESRFRHPMEGVSASERDQVNSAAPPLVLSNGVTVMRWGESRFEYITPPGFREWGDHVMFGADGGHDGSVVQVDVATATMRDSTLPIRRSRKLDRLWTATLESMAHYLASPDGVVEVTRTKLKRNRPAPSGF